MHALECRLAALEQQSVAAPAMRLCWNVIQPNGELSAIVAWGVGGKGHSGTFTRQPGESVTELRRRAGMSHD